MGRGVAYQYKYHMLVDDDAFNCEDDDTSIMFDEEAWDDFKDQIIKAFDAWPVDKWHGGDAYYFAESDRLYIGFDTGGACTCLFVVPKTYEHALTREEVEYKIWRDVERGFNQLMGLYPKVFSYWTSGYTSMLYTQRYKAER